MHTKGDSPYTVPIELTGLPRLARISPEMYGYAIVAPFVRVPIAIECLSCLLCCA